MSREREILKRKIECLEATDTVTAVCHVNQLRGWLSIIDEQRAEMERLREGLDEAHWETGVWQKLNDQQREASG